LVGAANCRGLPPSTAGHPPVAWFHISSLQGSRRAVWWTCCISTVSLEFRWEARVSGICEERASSRGGIAHSFSRTIADYLAQVRQSILECRRSSSSAEFGKCAWAHWSRTIQTVVALRPRSRLAPRQWPDRNLRFPCTGNEIVRRDRVSDPPHRAVLGPKTASESSTCECRTDCEADRQCGAADRPVAHIAAPRPLWRNARYSCA